jgi:hypothetical protein
MLAARVTLVVDGQAFGEARVFAEWTDDVAKSTRINRRVAEVTNATETADALQEGVEAQRAGDVVRAADRLGLVARLATEAGNAQALELLDKLVEIEDAATGRIRLKHNVDAMDLQMAEARSQRTTRTDRTKSASAETEGGQDRGPSR